MPMLLHILKINSQVYPYTHEHEIRIVPWGFIFQVFLIQRSPHLNTENHPPKISKDTWNVQSSFMIKWTY